MELLAEKFGNYLSAQLQLDEERREIVTFGAVALFHNGASLGLTLVLAALVGAFTKTVLALAAAALMRHATGGAHLRASLRCVLTTAVTFVLVGILGAQVGAAAALLPRFAAAGSAFILAAAGLAIVWRYAPVAAKTRPLSQTHRTRLRRLSMRLGLLMTALIPAAASYTPTLAGSLLAGFLVQCFTLTPTGDQAAIQLDRILDGRRGGE